MNKIFIGFDPRQAVSVSTLIHAITMTAKEPVSITPLVLETLPIKRAGLTPFTWSRFLVPHLCGYQGRGLFIDADMLPRHDISELFRVADTGKAAYVRKDQPPFERASMILFNCSHPQNAILTPDFIENRAKALHSIQWIPPEEVGDIPSEWNACVGYEDLPEHPKLLHFTQGVPQWWETKNQPYADEWIAARDAAVGATHSWFELMGRSVHAKHVLARLIKTGVCKDEMDYARKAGLIKDAAE